MPHQDEIVKKLLDNLDQLKPRRSNYDSVNQDISDYVLPNRGNFIKSTIGGERRDKRIFDNTAVVANETLASILHSGLTDVSSKWFNLRTRDDNLRDEEDMKRWLEEVNSRMESVFTRSASGFAQQNHEFFLDLCAYGTAVMWVTQEPGQGITFQARHPGEIYIEEDNNGFVDTVYREFKLTARQAAQKWGAKGVGTQVQQALENDPHKEMEFVHIVLPLLDYQMMMGEEVEPILKQFPYISIYIAMEDKHILDVGGFFEMPYLVARWEKLVGEVYGRSPSWNALSDTLMINIMSETVIKAAQKNVDPPLLMTDDGVMMPLQTFPGGVNIGAISDDGKPLMQPLPSGARLDIGLDMMEQRRDAIRQAYFIDQFQDRQGVQPLTATESTHRQENKLRLIGPQIRRIEDEYLSKLIDRVFAILKRDGKLPPVPASIQQSGVEALDLDIEYVSPLAFTQRSNKLQSYNRWFASIGTFIELDPGLVRNLDLDHIARDTAEMAGIPIDQIKPSDQVAAEDAAAQQQIQQQQQFAELQAGAETAATLQKSGIPVVPEQ
jgi:hypothetical protein